MRRPDELVGTIDLLPTIAAITQSPLAKDRKIDGMDVSGLLTGTWDQTPREEYLYYTSQGAIEGLRKGKWKLLVKKNRPPRNRPNAKVPPPEILLFDLSQDIGEQTNLAGEKPELVASMRSRMEELDSEVTANAREPWQK